MTFEETRLYGKIMHGAESDSYRQRSRKSLGPISSARWLHKQQRTTYSSVTIQASIHLHGQ